MKCRLMIIICSGLFLASVGCKSTPNQPAENPAVANQPPSNQTVANPPAGNQAVAGQIPSRRIYDKSYIPPSLYSKVDSKGDGYINKPLVVNELIIDSKFIYEVINDGASNYYDVRGNELAGAERTRILSQVKPLNR